VYDKARTGSAGSQNGRAFFGRSAAVPSRGRWRSGLPGGHAAPAAARLTGRENVRPDFARSAAVVSLRPLPTRITTVGRIFSASSRRVISCVLYTSDIDYLPVIETVRRMGKSVFVVGYREAIANDSPFLHVPEWFVDIGKEYMRSNYMTRADALIR
jgi:hypothetical protein